MTDISKVGIDDYVELERDGGKITGAVRAITLSSLSRTAWVIQGGIQVEVDGPNAWRVAKHVPKLPTTNGSVVIQQKPDIPGYRKVIAVRIGGEWVDAEDKSRRLQPSCWISGWQVKHNAGEEA